MSKIDFDLIQKFYYTTAATITIVVTAYMKLSNRKDSQKRSLLDILKNSIDINISTKMNQFVKDSYEDEIFCLTTKIRAQGKKRLGLIEMYNIVSHKFDWSQIREVIPYFLFDKEEIELKIRKYDFIFNTIIFYLGIVLIITAIIFAYITALLMEIKDLPFLIISGLIGFYGFKFIQPKIAISNAIEIKKLLEDNKKPTPQTE